MRNILTYYFKKRLPLFIVVLAISLLSTIVYLISTTLVRKESNSSYFRISDNGMIYLSIILLILCIFYSIFEFSFKMKRTSCDLFYSLPIKRRSLFIAKYIVGLTQLLLLFIANFIVVLIFAIANFAGKEFYNATTDVIFTYNFGYYFMFFGVMLVIATLLYSWFVFFFTRCNTTIDGLINMALSSTLICSVLIAIMTFITKINNDNYYIFSNYLTGSEYIPFVSIFIIVTKIYYASIGFNVDAPNILPIVITWTLCLASLVLFILFSEKERAENTFEISDSYFSYKVFLPTMIIALLAQCELSAFTFVAVIVGGYIGYVIYNRHFKLRKNDWLIFIISSGVGFILTLVASFI